MVVRSFLLGVMNRRPLYSQLIIPRWNFAVSGYNPRVFRFVGLVIGLLITHNARQIQLPLLREQMFDRILQSSSIGLEDTIKHLLPEFEARFVLLRLNINEDARLQHYIASTDLTINLVATSGVYNLVPVDAIYRKLLDQIPVTSYCAANNKRLIYFAGLDPSGRTPIPNNGVLDTVPLPLTQDHGRGGSIQENIICNAVGLDFTIVRPFNWIGPRMDFIPGIDGPRKNPCVLAYSLIRRDRLKLVNGGESLRTFIYIDDAIKAVLMMIENPQGSNGCIFDVGNPENRITVREFAEFMNEVYSNLSQEDPIPDLVLDVQSEELYGEAYEETVPDVTVIAERLGWQPTTPISELLKLTLECEHKAHRSEVKRVQIEENLNLKKKKTEELEKKIDAQRAVRHNEITTTIRNMRHEAAVLNKANQSKGVGEGQRVNIYHDF